MKRLHMLLGILLAVLLVSLTGCRSDNGSDAPAPDVAAETEADTQAPEENAAEPDPTPEPAPEPEPEETPAETDFAEMFPTDGFGEDGFWLNVRALDYVEMFTYSGLSVPARVHTVSEEELQFEIDSILAQFSAPAIVTDREVALGDTVNIDFVGSVDGVEFDGGSTGGMGTYVTIGVTSFIDDFLYQLIGSRPGDTVNVEVTFPEFYPQAPHLENQPALFITEINYIAEETVPELTDGFVTEFLYGMTGWTTVEEMKEYMISIMRHNALLHYIHDYFTTQVTVSHIPETILNYQHMVMIDFYRGQAANFGMELSDLLAIFMGMESIEELVEMNYDYSVREAMFNLVVQAVAETAGLTVTSAELEDYFYEHTGTRDYSMFAEAHGLPFLKNVVLTQLVIDYVIENAVLE